MVTHLLGRTEYSGVDVDGHVLFSTGESYQSATSNTVQFINRNGTDGNLLQFYIFGTAVGQKHYRLRVADLKT